MALTDSLAQSLELKDTEAKGGQELQVDSVADEKGLELSAYQGSVAGPVCVQAWLQASSSRRSCFVVRPDRRGGGASKPTADDEQYSKILLHGTFE